MNESLIEIDRVPLSFLTAASHDRAEWVTRRVRDAVAGSLSRSLASACGTDFDADDAYVFIDRLDVQCAIASHWTDDAIAGAFAKRLAGALLWSRERGHALVFRDRAEFVSAYLAACAEGDADRQWWFAEFDGLSALPASARMRTLLVNEPLAWDAMARLSPESRRRVSSALGETDAERILAAIAATTDSERRAAPSMAAILRALESAGHVPLSSGARRLVAALAEIAGLSFEAASGPYAGSSAVISARILAAVRAVDRILALAREGRLPWFAADDAASAIVAWSDASGLDAGERAALRALDGLEVLVARVATLQSAATEDERAAEPASFDYTPFGGALLLCVVLVRAGWWARWRDRLLASGLGERADPLAAWLALAVVARALNPDHPESIETDGPLRRVFGVPHTMGVARGRRLDRLARAHGRALLHEFARRVPGCDESTAAYLRAQCLSLPAGVRADGAEARLGRPPLDVLLGFSGLKRATVRLPDGRTLSLNEEIAA